MLAGFGGIMIAPILSVEPGMGDGILILVFVVIVIGGVGSIRGAFIAALPLDLLVGYGAMTSFGHAAFIGIGAYAVGILSAHGVSDGLIALPVALAASGLFAVISGFVCLRAKSAYFLMITLAFGPMVFFTASSLSIYGGDDGMTIYDRSTIAG